MRERWRDDPWRGGGPLPAPGAGWNGIRVGSEGCSRLVPPAEWVGRTPGGLHALVTPPLTPSGFGPVQAAAEAALASSWAEVVVNDWGLLDVLASEGKGRLTAGRLLLRARRGPGSTDPWQGLDSLSRSWFAWGPLLDPPLLGLLGEMGVSRLELDPPRHWEPVPVPDGFALSLHADHRVVTLAGSCPFLFDPEKGRWREGGCSLDCASSPPLLLSAPRLPRPLVQWGEVVLEEASLPEEGLLGGVDRLVFSPNLFPLSP